MSRKFSKFIQDSPAYSHHSHHSNKMNIEYLRRKVSSKEHKMKQTHIVLLCLKFVEEHPEAVSIVGCCWDSDNTFMINSSIFGKFIERDPNTINRNFRSHGFTQNKSSQQMRARVPKRFGFDNIPDAKNWFQRQCPFFTKQTNEEEARTIKHHKLIPKKHIKKEPTVSPSNADSSIQLNYPNTTNTTNLPANEPIPVFEIEDSLFCQNENDPPHFFQNVQNDQFEFEFEFKGNESFFSFDTDEYFTENIFGNGI